jgi:hypothetical protein
MCNLYSITKGQQAIRDLAGAMRDLAGNMPLLPGVFPDHSAPDRNRLGWRRSAQATPSRPGRALLLTSDCAKRVSSANVVANRESLRSRTAG